MKKILIVSIILSVQLLHAQHYVSPKVYTESMVVHPTNNIMVFPGEQSNMAGTSRYVLPNVHPSQGQSVVNRSDVSSKGKTWAVIIGIGQYQRLAELKYAGDDARRMYNLLKNQKHASPSRDRIHLLLHEQATLYNIRTAFHEVMLNARPEDRVFIYYSGHGLPGALVPSDYEDGKNMVTHEEIARLLGVCKAKYKLCIVDACHSGGLRASNQFTTTSYRNFQVNPEKPGVMALLLSSQAKEYSFESDDLRQGVFSHFLLRGLDGEADFDNDSSVSIGELYTFVYREVSQYTHFMQFPVLSGKYDQDMVVGD